MNWQGSMGRLGKWATFSVCAALWLFALASCKGPTAGKLITVGISQDPSGSLQKGAIVQLTAKGTFSDGSTQVVTSKVTWTTSDAKIVTVTAEGVAKGLKIGVANISAYWQGVASAPFQVEVAGLTEITIAPLDPSPMALGSSLQFQTSPTWSDGSFVALGSGVVWTSSNTKVITVSSAGVATAIAPGQADISVSSQGVTSNTVSVTVLPFSSVVVTAASPGTIVVGSTLQFTAKTIFPDGTSTDVTSQAVWRTSDPGVAAFTSSGTVLGIAPGLVVVQASFQGVFGAPASLTVVAGLPKN